MDRKLRTLSPLCSNLLPTNEEDNDLEEDDIRRWNDKPTTTTTEQNERQRAWLSRHSNNNPSNSSKQLSPRVSHLDMSSGLHTIDFVKDDNIYSMTYDRRIALYLQKKYKWYNPQLLLNRNNESNEYVEMKDIKTFGRKRNQQQQQQLPSLEKAWAYFEHVTLPRYLDHDAATTSPSERQGSVDEQKKSAACGSTRSCCCCPPSQEQLDLAEPGEDRYPTSLYSPIKTPMNQMGDFGLGVGLYFGTLWGITVLTFLTGLLHIPVMMYYESSQYNDDPSKDQDFFSIALWGSAICTDQEFVPCPTCQVYNFEDVPHRLAYATTTFDYGGEDYSSSLIFAKKNHCSIPPFLIGMINYMSFFFILIGLTYLNDYLVKKEIQFDEDEQTAQDYSVVVKNAPMTATSPQEWKDYFEKELKTSSTNNSNNNIHVTCCTVAKDNYLLIRALVERREILQQLKWKIKSTNDSNYPSYSLQHLSQLADDEEKERTNIWEKYVKPMIVPGIPELLSQLLKVNKRIQELALLHKTQGFPVVRVFCSFETEAAQRHVLRTLSKNRKVLFKCGRNNSRNNGGGLCASFSCLFCWFFQRRRKQEVNEKDKENDDKSNLHLFRNEFVLNVKQAVEPSTIRWNNDLSNTRMTQHVLKMVLTTYCWFVAMILVCFVVTLCQDRQSATFAAYAIALFNVAFPEFAKVLTDYESHASEEKRQTSLYIKIAAFRWINTVIIVTWITPFTSTLDGSNSINSTENILEGVCAIFFAEIVTTNLLKFTDPMGVFYRHYMAPRAQTQEEMNSFMRGEEWNLAERYTNMTKCFFLAVWYCSIYPGALFLCSITSLLNYYADRYSLMRTWRQAPRLGSKISSFSRRYFLPLALSAMALASSYTWAGFPFDNLCQNEQVVDEDYFAAYIGTYYITTMDELNTQDDGGKQEEEQQKEQITVSNGDSTYRYCSQDLFRHGSSKILNFPAIPRWQPDGYEWMTSEQELLTSIYGWTSVLIVGAVLIFISIKIYQTMFTRERYQECGEDQGIPFSDVASISSYVPEVKSEYFSYPLLAVDTDDVYEELYEWKDPEHPYSYYDLTKDVREVLTRSSTCQDGSVRRMLSDDEINNLFSQIRHWSPYKGDAGVEVIDRKPSTAASI